MSVPTPDTPDIGLTPFERASWDALMRGPRPPWRVRLVRRLKHLAGLLVLLVVFLASAALVFGLAAWLVFEFCIAVIDKWPG